MFEGDRDGVRWSSAVYHGHAVYVYLYKRPVQLWHIDILSLESDHRQPCHVNGYMGSW